MVSKNPPSEKSATPTSPNKLRPDKEWTPRSVGAGMSLKTQEGTDVELFVEGKNLTDLDFLTVSDPQCTLKVRQCNQQYATWISAGETEVIDNNLNPEWIKHFSVKYIFHKDLDLLFQVWHFETDEDKRLIGETTIQLSQIMLSPGQTSIQDLFKEKKGNVCQGQLKIQADAVKKSEDIVKFQICAELHSRQILCCGSDNPYLMIERGKMGIDNEWMRVFKTDNKFDDPSPWWDAYQMTMTDFCNNNKHLPIRLTVKSYVNSGDHPVYGSIITTTRDIEMANGGMMDITDAKGRKSGSISFNQFEMDMRPSLVEYLNDGWLMEVSVGIDFTLSNLEICDYRSLHRQAEAGEMNQYEKAIFEVCNVMTPYAMNQKFHAYGFGAIPKYIGSNKVHRCWNMNGNLEDERVDGTMGVLESYYKAINGSVLAGPTYFTELFKKIKGQIVQNINQKGTNGNRIYHVVIIITDGNCHDMEATKKILVEMSGMPFSAVIVGVGDGQFDLMEELDADEAVLRDAEGKAAVRDIVQLVKYEDFKNLGMRELALEVLGEVPDQFVDYMVMKEVQPKMLYQVKEEDLLELHRVQEQKKEQKEQPLVAHHAHHLSNTSAKQLLGDDKSI